MRAYKIFAIMFFVFSQNSNAIVINNTAFSNYGGDIKNTDKTFEIPYAKLNTESLRQPFLSVGYIVASGCTGTWIGDSKDKKYIYVLTAAHCVPYKGEKGSTNLSFRNYYNWLVGQDGFYYIPPERIKNPGDIFTDIAILKLEKIASILDKNMNYITAPLLFDLSIDMDEEFIDFVGYGLWGIPKDKGEKNWERRFDQRRAWGHTKIAEIWDIRGFTTKFDNPIGAESWARVSSGDSGSAWWWQDKNSGIFYIIAETTGHTSYSIGVGVSRYKNWIKSVAPEVKWGSELKIGCSLLIWVKNKWVWAAAPQIKNQNECTKASIKCNLGGACYKWDFLL